METRALNPHPSVEKAVAIASRRPRSRRLAPDREAATALAVAWLAGEVPAAACAEALGIPYHAFRQRVSGYLREAYAQGAISLSGPR